MGPHQISVSVDGTGWLHQLTADLEVALADLANTMKAVADGTYAKNVSSGQHFGLLQVRFPNAADFVPKAVARAAEDCFRASVANFISFLDKLIATSHIRNEGITTDRDITSEEDLKIYVNDYLSRKISKVASDRTLTNPRKIEYFPTVPDFSKQAVSGYFALRRALEHHQGVATEKIELCFLKKRLFVGEQEITHFPIFIKSGGTLGLKVTQEVKTFLPGEKIELTPEDVYGIILTLRMAIAPQVFDAHVAASQPLDSQSQASP
jgi:hypothetical protein